MSKTTNITNQAPAGAVATGAGYSDAGMLSLLLGTTTEVFILFDAEMRVRSFSGAAVRQLAQWLDVALLTDIPGMEVLARFGPDVVALSAQAIRGRSGAVVVGIKGTAPVSRNIRIQLTCLNDNNGSLAGLLCACAEVNESQPGLTLHQHTLQTLVNSFRETCVLLDRNLQVCGYNASADDFAQDLLGQPLHPGQGFTHLLGKNAAAAELERMAAQALQGACSEAELTFDLPAGRRTFLVHCRPMHVDGADTPGCLVLGNDITVYKNAVSDIADSEERWRFALEGGNQGVWDWDIKAGQVFYSRSWHLMMGYEPGTVGPAIGDWQARIHPEDHSGVTTNIRTHFEGTEASYESEYRMLDAGGSYRWILSRAMIMRRDADGTPVRMIGTHTDITRRKLVEEQFKAIFYQNPLPMWTFDRTTLRFLDVNEAAIAQYGYSRAEFCRLTILDIRPESDRTLVQEEISHAAKDSQVQPGRWRHIRKDGSVLWASVTGFTFNEGSKTVTLITAEDITHKIADEQRLAASEQWYRQLFYSIPLPALIYDPTDLRIIEVNESARSHYGYAADRFTTLRLSDLVAGGSSQCIGPELEEATIGRLVHRTADGALRAVEMWSGNMGVPGSRMRLAIINDVTDKAAAAEALRASHDRFRFVMNATNDIVWDWQMGNDTILWSDLYEDVLGWRLPADNLLPVAQAQECFHPDDRDRVIESLREAIKEQSVSLWENAFRFRRSDGSYAYVLNKGFIVRDEKGWATRMIGAMHDISEQQHQQEVQELELRVFARSSRPGSVINEVLGLITAGLEQLHPQLKAFIAVGEAPDRHQVVAVRSATPIAEWVTRFVATHKNEWGKNFLRKTLVTHNLESGEEKLLVAEWPSFEAGQVVCLPAFTTEGHLLASLVVVTAKKGLSNTELSTLLRMQNLMRILLVQHISVEQLRVANERFDNVLKATHDLIWDWDLQNGQFYRSEEGVRQVYGFNPDHTPGNVHSWMERIHADDLGRVRQVIERIIKGHGEDTFDAEYRFLRDDGTYSYLYDRGTIIRDHAGRPIRMIGAAQDISERKRLEQELLEQELHRQKMISQATIDTQEQERAEIGKELHDNVNQILTTTKLYLEMAVENTGLKDELIAKAGKNILHVINEIRQLSRSLMDPSIGDLGLVESIHDLAENINVTRRIRVELTADETINELLDASRQLMVYRIIQEALGNVVRHSEASKAHIKLVNKQQQILLEINDNGVGFAPDAIQSGVGLKNIRNRVYLVNGTLQIKSAPGQGTTLTIIFPIHKSPL